MNNEIIDEYWKYFNREVDTWLHSQYSDRQIISKISIYKASFLIKFPKYSIYKDFESFKDYIKMEYKKIVGKKIGILSFEEWSQKRKK